MTRMITFRYIRRVALSGLFSVFTNILATSAIAGTVTSENWGHTPDGQTIRRFVLSNTHKMTVRILTYGGTIQSIEVPDRNGISKNIVLGFGDLDHYLHDVREGQLYFGAMIGRYANRIAHGQFTLDGQTYHVPISLAPHALHGGKEGFDKKTWTAVSWSGDKDTARLRLELTSPDGDQGFPGNLKVSVDYVLGNDNSLTLHFHATTDRPTVVSLTSHSFWNLDGEDAGSVENQIVQINADRFTPTDPTGIPTGSLTPVEGTPYDFRKPQPIGAHLRDAYPQIRQDHGYDKNFVLNGKSGSDPRLAATVYAPETGRVLDILTTQPGLQFYTSNGLDGHYYGIGGKAYRQTDAIALETEAFPDSPNHPSFPNVVLRSGEAYDATTVFKFSSRK